MSPWYQEGILHVKFSWRYVWSFRTKVSDQCIIWNNLLKASSEIISWRLHTKCSCACLHDFGRKLFMWSFPQQTYERFMWTIHTNTSCQDDSWRGHMKHSRTGHDVVSWSFHEHVMKTFIWTSSWHLFQEGLHVVTFMAYFRRSTHMKPLYFSSEVFMWCHQTIVA